MTRINLGLTCSQILSFSLAHSIGIGRSAVPANGLMRVGRNVVNQMLDVKTAIVITTHVPLSTYPSNYIRDHKHTHVTHA